MRHLCANFGMFRSVSHAWAAVVNLRQTWLVLTLSRAALLLFCSLTQFQTFGQEGATAAPNRSSQDDAVSRIADIAKASAFKENCILLVTKFERDGVVYPSKTGIGCMILNGHTGYRILAMPASLLKHIQVLPEQRQNSVDCSLLLATKLGNVEKYRDPIASFDAQFEFSAISNASIELSEADRRIYRDLNERGEFVFQSQPLSSVMKWIRESCNIPIVIDKIALEAEDRTGQEKISLNLPGISCRSALNLILEPFELTYVVEHEVLKVTTNKSARDFAVNPAMYRDWKKSIERTEIEIQNSLYLRSEISFWKTPLVEAMKFFKDTHSIPIVIDVPALLDEDIDFDEPITLELASISLEAALKLILEPLKLTFVIENEVLKITTKKAAKAAASVEAKAIGAIQTGILAFGCSNPTVRRGLGSGVVETDQELNYFELSRIVKYRTSQDANEIDPSTAKPIIRHASKDGGNKLQDFVAIRGPVVVQVDRKNGVAFLNLPGDFQVIPIPAQQGIAAAQDIAAKQCVLHQNDWLAINEQNKYPEQIVEGSPVVNERGEPIGLLIDKKVISLFELFIGVMSNNPADWGYWGTEEKPSVVANMLATPALLPASMSGGVPLLDSIEIKEQIDLKKQLTIRNLSHRKVSFG